MPAGQREASGGREAQGESARRVLVIAHVYYPELWPELAEHVGLIPGRPDLVVTLVRGSSEHLADAIRAQFPGATVRIVENRGRDLWPFLQCLDLVAGHDAVLKVHTKRSPHMRGGDQWRHDLLAGLCGSTAQVEQVLHLLGTDPRIGLVAAPGNVLGREFMGANRASVEWLARRAGVRVDRGALWFPAGSMFWAHPAVLAPLAELGLTAADFADETGAIDGTLPHALERFLGVAAQRARRAVIDAGEVADLVAAGSRGRRG